MKKTINYLFAALTLFAAASCTKDIQPNEQNDGQSELRTIELSFEDSGITKVGVSDRTPQWEAGDTIWISNGASSEVKKLAAADITDNVAKISTSLSGTLYAVYPSSAQNGVIDDSGTKKIGFRIPTSTDGAFGNAHIAVAEGTTSLIFRNVVSILKITTEADTKLVNISSASAIAGEFKVTYDTGSVEAGTTQAKGINITSSAAGEKYVAVASGVAFNALEFTAVKTATNWASKKSSQSTALAINTMYNIGDVSGWSYTTTNSLLWAKFSVEANKQVRFSKGNLYCERSSSESSDWVWRFKADQYLHNSYPAGTEGSRTAKSTDTAIDHFCWGYDASGSVNPVEEAQRSSFTDWGSISTLPGNSESTKIWNTLSVAEWNWIIGPGNSPNPGTNCRISSTINGTANARYAEVKVNGVGGMLIFPDSFTWPKGITTSKPTKFNTDESNWNNVEYTAAEFILLESAGCVFLPAAGGRIKSAVGTVGSCGYYWSSTPTSNMHVYYLDFRSSSVCPTSSILRDMGYSVRLVSAAK